MNIALIGAGGIGKIWASAIKKINSVSLRAVADLNLESAQIIANDFEGCRAVSDPAEIFADPNIRGVIIATPHKWLASLTRLALQASQHVLCEKPAGVSSVEVRANIELAKRQNLVFMIGFNHRYHPAFLEAKKIFDEGGIGEIQFIRARYGFGGRSAYEKEWRFKKAISGGGELIDQGMHMIDLARWFMGDFVDVRGFAENLFWGGKVEDNGFVLLRTVKHQVASIHVSWTNWDWVHSFEIFGKAGYLIIAGLDQRYHGPEKLIIGKHDPRSGKFPEERVIVYEDENKDDSLRRELEDFVTVSQRKNISVPQGEDAEQALRIVEAIYNQNNKT